MRRRARSIGSISSVPAGGLLFECCGGRCECLGRQREGASHLETLSVMPTRINKKLLSKSSLLTGHQRMTVLKTWHTLSRDISSLGISTMFRLLEKNSGFVQLFHFQNITHVDLLNHHKFRQHAFWLIQAVSAMVENINDLDLAMSDMLVEIGEKHATIPNFSSKYFSALPNAWYGVWEEHLKERFTAQTKKCWSRLFQYMVGLLMDGCMDQAILERIKGPQTVGVMSPCSSPSQGGSLSTPVSLSSSETSSWLTASDIELSLNVNNACSASASRRFVFWAGEHEKLKSVGGKLWEERSGNVVTRNTKDMAAAEGGGEPEVMGHYCDTVADLSKSASEQKTTCKTSDEAHVGSPAKGLFSGLSRLLKGKKEGVKKTKVCLQFSEATPNDWDCVLAHEGHRVQHTAHAHSLLELITRLALTDGIGENARNPSLSKEPRVTEIAVPAKNPVLPDPQ